MKTYANLYSQLCSYDNLELAFRKARRGKTAKPYVIAFEKNLESNLMQLRSALLMHCYDPKPLVQFIIRDPKTRTISKSAFRDRVVHHALVNILEPIYEKRFIHDSYANRKGRGTLKALKRFDSFKRKASKNNTRACYVLKADIRHYFEEVDQSLLLRIITERIKDESIIWLIRKILDNYAAKAKGKGMPLGNLTSQFFANVYLNELDQFVKCSLKAKYYIRYVDDFILLASGERVAEAYKDRIRLFLQKRLAITLHPTKSRIYRLGSRITLLGFRVFYYHRLLKRQNMIKMRRTYASLKARYIRGETGYDTIYNFLEGWLVYAKNADTYAMRRNFLAEFESAFPDEISTKELSRHCKACQQQSF